MQVNDYVIWNTEGICKVVDIIYPDFVKNTKREYYVLMPIENNSVTVYIPVDIADQRCRKPITVDEAKKLIASIDEIEMAEISNDKECERTYRSILEEGDLWKVVSIYKNIHERRQCKMREGKKNKVVDEKYYQLVEHNLCHELGFVLHLSKDEVKERLLNYKKD